MCLLRGHSHRMCFCFEDAAVKWGKKQGLETCLLKAQLLLTWAPQTGPKNGVLLILVWKLDRIAKTKGWE